MTEKQKRFVDEYLISANASDAAIKAGYSKKSARVIGQENLLKPAISKALDERLNQMRSEKIARTQEVFEHLTAVLRGEIKETIVTPSGKKFVVPVRESDRLQAAEKLLRAQGAYREQVDVKVDGATLLMQTLATLDEDDA